MKSGAKNLKTRLHRKDFDLEASSDMSEMKSIASQPQMDFTGLEANDLIELLQKECGTRMRLADELHRLRERVEIQTEDQATQNIVKEQFAAELERLKKNETVTLQELDLCRKEKDQFEALYLVLKSERDIESEEVLTFQRQKAQLLAKNESLSLEIAVNKSNYQKLEEMLSDDDRLEKVQYQNVKKMQDELAKCRNELVEVKREKENSEVLRFQYEKQLVQLEAQLNDAKLKFEEIVGSTQQEIFDAKTREERLDELLKTKQSELEERQRSLDSMSKEFFQVKEKFENYQEKTDQQHEENIKRLEKGFSMTLHARDDEVEKLQIISNKYKKKNESLSKDIRNLLKKLEMQQRHGTPSVGSRGSTPGNDSDLQAPPLVVITSCQSNMEWERDSIASLPISFSRRSSKVRLKKKLEQAKVWGKQHNIKKVIEKLPLRSESHSIRRCAATVNLSKSQLVAKCDTLQLLAKELTLQVDSYHEQVRNLKFASTYLGKRVLALESTLELMPGEEIPTNVGSRIADLRAVIESEKQENERKHLGVVKESRKVETLNDQKSLNLGLSEHHYECKDGVD